MTGGRDLSQFTIKSITDVHTGIDVGFREDNSAILIPLERVQDSSWQGYAYKRYFQKSLTLHREVSFEPASHTFLNNCQVLKTHQHAPHNVWLVLIAGAHSLNWQIFKTCLKTPHMYPKPAVLLINFQFKKL